ncbi:biliverdin-producing heme oxygenase [Stakelama marina]|uniref:biliverdin-producing heme oxygenase n=1 Tax=Stakelama marina TaxID=2826939 RepID=UPI0024C29E54|nr:biliverdin-producing heme oxygenase [Stakelama marina]
MPLEAALDAAGAAQLVEDWPERRRGDALLDDLSRLDCMLPVLDQMQVAGTSEIAGTLYVLEGSRLGGRFLARRVPDNLPSNYLDLHQSPDKWRTLLAKLDSLLYQPAELSNAVAVARSVFRRFDAAGRRWLAKE